MQLPVAIFKLELSGPGSQRLYVSEIRATVDYDAFCQVCQMVFSSETMKRKEKGLTKEALDVLCQLETTESDRCLIKYSVCKMVQRGCRRASKGFPLKLNPDAHYSNAMYSSLDELQKKDGTVSLILNRDDAARFRFDTTYTHRRHSALCLSDYVEVTTRAQYVNKYSSTLQVSSYLFLETEKTPEVCLGIVKAHHLHQKSPAQHMADLRMLEESSDFKDLFSKQVEFIRVDGGADELFLF